MAGSKRDHLHEQKVIDNCEDTIHVSTIASPCYSSSSNEEILKGLFGIDVNDTSYNESQTADNILPLESGINHSLDNEEIDTSSNWKIEEWNNGKEEASHIENLTPSTCSPRNSFQFASVCGEEHGSYDAARVSLVGGNSINDTSDPISCLPDTVRSPDIVEDEGVSNNNHQYSSQPTGASAMVQQGIVDILPEVDQLSHKNESIFSIVEMMKGNERPHLNNAIEVEVGSSVMVDQFNENYEDEHNVHEGSSLNIDTEEQYIEENHQRISDVHTAIEIPVPTDANYSSNDQDHFDEIPEVDVSHHHNQSPGEGLQSGIELVHDSCISVDEMNTNFDTLPIVDMNSYISSIHGSLGFSLDGSIFKTVSGSKQSKSNTGIRKKKISKREAARVASKKAHQQEKWLAQLANDKKITDDVLLRLKPKKQRRAAHFDKPVPSRFCHVCSRTPKNVRLVVCSKIKEGVCRKVICEKCFERYNYGDFHIALTNENSGWICPHCRGTCPERAQCRTYQRINDRLRANRLKQGGPKNHSGRGRRKKEEEEIDNRKCEADDIERFFNSSEKHVDGGDIAKVSSNAEVCDGNIEMIDDLITAAV